MGEILGDQGLARAIGSDKNEIVSPSEPLEAEEFVDLGAIDCLGPGPVEIGERLEAARIRGLRPSTAKRPTPIFQVEARADKPVPRPEALAKPRNKQR